MSQRHEWVGPTIADSSFDSSLLFGEPERLTGTLRGGPVVHVPTLRP
jgi:hypothetical protein